MNPWPSSPFATPTPERGRAPSRDGATVRGLATLLVLVSIGCFGGSPPPPPMAPVPEADRLYYDDSGGVTDSLRMVVREPDEWREMWSRATARRAEPPPLPTVDFEDQMVLVIAAGRMSPGDGIRVDSVGFQEIRTADGDTEEALTAVVRTTRSCSEFQGDAYPVEIVRVREHEGPVQFIERSESGANCRMGSSGGPPPDR